LLAVNGGWVKCEVLEEDDDDEEEEFLLSRRPITVYITEPRYLPTSIFATRCLPMPIKITSINYFKRNKLPKQIKNKLQNENTPISVKM